MTLPIIVSCPAISFALRLHRRLRHSIQYLSTTKHSQSKYDECRSCDNEKIFSNKNVRRAREMMSLWETSKQTNSANIRDNDELLRDVVKLELAVWWCTSCMHTLRQRICQNCSPLLSLLFARDLRVHIVSCCVTIVRIDILRLFRPFSRSTSMLCQLKELETREQELNCLFSRASPRRSSEIERSDHFPDVTWRSLQRHNKHFTWTMKQQTTSNDVIFSQKSQCPGLSGRANNWRHSICVVWAPLASSGCVLLSLVVDSIVNFQSSSAVVSRVWIEASPALLSPGHHQQHTTMLSACSRNIKKNRAQKMKNWPSHKFKTQLDFEARRHVVLLVVSSSRASSH